MRRACLALFCGLTLACGGGSPTGDKAPAVATTPGTIIRSQSGFEAEIAWNPLKVTLREPRSGRVLGQLGSSDPGLFYDTGTGPQFLQGQPAVEARASDTYRATYTLPGGRQATVEVRWSNVESLLIIFHVDGADVEKRGALIAAGPDEHYFGLMERVVDGFQQESWRPGITTALDLRGQKVLMFTKPTVDIYAPFYISSAGYGAFVEGTWPGEYDLAASRGDGVTLAFQGDALTFHLIPGPEPSKILGRYVQIAGQPLLPPRWVFKPWRYRDEHRHLPAFFDGTPYRGPFNTQLVEDVLMFEALDIPNGVYWIDRPWAIGRDGYDDFEWDRQRVPNPESMIRWLDGKGIKFLIWIAPWVNGKMVNEAMARGYLMPDLASQGKHPHIDFTNPEAKQWWQGHLKQLINAGVAGFKMDRGDEEVPYALELKTANGKSTREVRNDYPRLYAAAASEILTKTRGDDFILLPRAGYTGSQSLAAFWAGDTDYTEWGLRSVIIGGQRCALMGFSLWGSDIGGFSGGIDREVTARWIAFGAFTPIMQVGPTQNRAPWDMPGEPHYDAELIAVWRFYAKLHTALQDYSYRHVQIAHDTGMPLIRPMLLAYPDDRKAVELWEQFLYGEDILVGAIWRKGQRDMSMYLPAGEWRDAWNPAMVSRGPQPITVDCPFHKIPIFVRAGSSVDLGDLNALWQDSLQRAQQPPDLAALAKTVR